MSLRVKRDVVRRAQPRGAARGVDGVRKPEDAEWIGTYGPSLLHEALLGSELRGECDDVGLRVVDMPRLNRVDAEWLAVEIAPYENVLVLEDHAHVGALGDALRRELAGRAAIVFSVEGWPACGSPEEALRFHGLDGESLAQLIAAELGIRVGA